MAVSITVDELMAELTRLGVGDTASTDGVRCRDLQEKWGVSDKKVRQIMNRACDAGLAERTWVTISDGWGKTTKTQGYRFTLPEAKRRGKAKSGDGQ